MAVTFNVTVSDNASARFWAMAKLIPQADGTTATDAMTNAQRKAHIEYVIKKNEAAWLRSMELNNLADPDLA